MKNLQIKVGFTMKNINWLAAYNSILPDTNMRLVNKYQKEFSNFTYMPPKNEKLGDSEIIEEDEEK